MQGLALPEALVLGPGDAKGRMEGSHTNPVIQATWQVPAAEASGHVKLDKDTMQLSSKYACHALHVHPLFMMGPMLDIVMIYS